MTHTLIQRFHFDAAHYLPYHMGDCSRMHGHTWHCQAEVRGKMGGHGCMVWDFSHFKRVIREIVDAKLDHRILNETIPMESPTCEMLAQWLFKKLDKKVTESGHTLVAVEVWEGENSGCRFEPKE